MRRYFVQIISILCIGILFIGCQSNNNETKENETTTEAEFVFPVEIPVISDDPEGKLYFTCKNINTDIYMKDSTRPYQQLGILSLEPLELDKIQVSVPVENSYAVYIEEIACQLHLP